MSTYYYTQVGDSEDIHIFKEEEEARAHLTTLDAPCKLVRIDNYGEDFFITGSAHTIQRRN